MLAADGGRCHSRLLTPPIKILQPRPHPARKRLALRRRPAVEPHVDGHVLVGPGRAGQAALGQVGLDQGERQPGQAQALVDHGVQGVGEVGLVDGAQARGVAQFVQVAAQDLAQGHALRVVQVGHQRAAAVGGQGVLGQLRDQGDADGDQRVLAHGQPGQMVALQAAFDGGLGVAHEQVHLALQQHFHAVVQAGGDHFPAQLGHGLVEGGDDARQDGVRQRAAGRDGDGFIARAVGALQQAVGLLQDAQHFMGRGQQRLAGCRERGGLVAALDQGRARPFLQRADAAAKGRVGDVAALGGLVEAAGVGQGLQVLQQFEVEFVHG